MKIQTKIQNFEESANIERSPGGSTDQQNHFGVSITAILENYPENLKNA